MKLANMREVRNGFVYKLGGLAMAAFAVSGLVEPVAIAGPADQCYMPNPPESCYGGYGGYGGTAGTAGAGGASNGGASQGGNSDAGRPGGGGAHGSAFG